MERTVESGFTDLAMSPHQPFRPLPLSDRRRRRLVCLRHLMLQSNTFLNMVHLRNALHIGSHALNSPELHVRKKGRRGFITAG